MAQPEESEEHKAWRRSMERAKQWQQDFAAYLTQHFGEDGAEEIAGSFADFMEQRREEWARELADVVEPPYLKPAEEMAGDLPGRIPGAPIDAFAGRAAYDPHA